MLKFLAIIVFIILICLILVIFTSRRKQALVVITLQDFMKYNKDNEWTVENKSVIDSINEFFKGKNDVTYDSFLEDDSGDDSGE